MKTKNYCYLLLFAFLFGVACSNKESVTPSILLSQNELLFSCDIESKSIEINSTHPYIVYSVPDWVSLNYRDGAAGISHIDIKALANHLNQTRTGVIVFSIFDGNRYVTANLNITQSAANSHIEGGETIFNVSESNRFSNGDMVGFENVNQVHAVSQVITPSNDIESLGEIRDFYFDFTVIPTTFQFVVSMELPDNQGWKICKFEDDVWQELQNVFYDQDRVRIPLTLNLSSIHASQTKGSARIFAVRVAWVKMESFISDIEMIKDPYQANPFGALVKFQSQNDVIPTMTLIGQDDNDIVHSFDVGKMHEIDVLGLYNQSDNKVYIDCKNQYGTTLRSNFTIRVDYPFFNTMRVNTSYAYNFKNVADMLYIVTGGGSFNASGDASTPWPGGDQLLEEKIPLGFDQYGKIRWAYNKHLKEAGQIYPILYNNKKCFMYYVQGAFGVSVDDFDPYIKIIDMTGKEIAYYPNLRSKGIRRIHHDAIMINDHIVAMPETKNNADECQIIEFDLKTGAVVKRIDLDNIIDPDRPDILGNQNFGEDRVHINSLAYSPGDDSYVVSARHQGVIKIRRSATDKSGLVWWMTPHYNVGPDYLFSLLTPVNFAGDDYENWNLGQHAVSILPNGDIMMFDNHNEPLFDAKAEKRISRVVVFRMNETDMTVTKVNEWKTPQNDFSVYQSSAQMLSNGNVLSGWSTHKRVYETTYPDGRILFQGDFTPANYRGDIYRFYKTNLYK